MSKRPPKNSKFEYNSPVVLCWRSKIFESKNRRFVPKRGTFPTETITLVVRSSSLWEAYTQTCPKWDKKITMACWCRSMVACQVSWISDEFWIYYNLKTRYLNVCGLVTVTGCLKFIPFLAWDISMQPMTHIWVFNQFICIRACACSSNLNAHKCIENLVNA